MLTKQHEIDFGNNDQAAAKVIDGTSKYHSWTVIISFYSALHFVRSKVFPITETVNGKTGLITARYRNYNLDPSLATRALEYLDAIKTACLQTIPPGTVESHLH